MHFSPWRILLILCPILCIFRPILSLQTKSAETPKRDFRQFYFHFAAGQPSAFFSTGTAASDSFPALSPGI